MSLFFRFPRSGPGPRNQQSGSRPQQLVDLTNARNDCRPDEVFPDQRLDVTYPTHRGQGSCGRPMPTCTSSRRRGYPDDAGVSRCSHHLSGFIPPEMTVYPELYITPKETFAKICGTTSRTVALYKIP